MASRIEEIESLVMDALRAAGEPVREVVLFERVNVRGASVDPATFQACLERLESLGHVRVRLERRDMPSHDPAPFEARYYYPAD